MSKKRQHVLPCGRVRFFRQYGPKDFVKKDVRAALLSQTEELEKFYAYNSSGRKRKVWAENAYNKFVTLLVGKLVDHLMESNRIQTGPDRFWAIAGFQKDTKHLNWHTDGRTFGVTIQGMQGDYRILLSRRRKKELRNRIENGQKFHRI